MVELAGYWIDSEGRKRWLDVFGRQCFPSAYVISEDDRHICIKCKCGKEMCFDKNKVIIEPWGVCIK